MGRSKTQDDIRVKRRPIRDSVKKVVWAKTNGRCFYCGHEVMPDPVIGVKEQHIDHVLPLNLGGEDCIENLALACSDCNLRKKDKSIEQYRQYLRVDWAESFKQALEDLELLACGAGTSIGDSLAASLRDMISLLMNSNVLFYGEIGETDRARWVSKESQTLEYYL